MEAGRGPLLQLRGLLRRLRIADGALRPRKRPFASLASTLKPAAYPPKSSLIPSSLRAELPRLAQEISRFDVDVPVEQASTPPSSWFTDPAFHELELASVFTDNWIAVGSVGQLSAPGHFSTGKVGPHPYILIRDDQGHIRCFYNVCRHHAMRLLTHDCGRVNKITCGYHGWEYRLDGRLGKATRISGIKDFNAKDFGLLEIKTAVWGPLVFVLLGPEARGQGVPPGGLGELRALLDKQGFSEGLTHVKRRSYVVGCNWKVVVDNYDDGGYHVPYAHKGLDSNLNLQSYRTTVHEGYSLQTCRAAGGEGASERLGAEAVYAHVYPNLMINRYGPWCDVNMVFPLAPNRCEIVFDYFLQEDFVAKHTPEELNRFVEESMAASHEVQVEDTELCQGVQMGLESAAYDVGRYAPRVEHADHDFHVRLGKELAEAVARLKSQVEGPQRP